MGARINGGHKYVPLSAEDKFKLLAAFRESFARFAAETRYDLDGVSCRVDVLFDIFERVEMRKAYFYVFYDGKIMSEQNEMSLICFWLIKLSPFFDSGKRGQNLNATFAVYLFLSMLARVNGARGRKTAFSPEYVNNLRYAILVQIDGAAFRFETTLSFGWFLSFICAYASPPTANRAVRSAETSPPARNYASAKCDDISRCAILPITSAGVQSVASAVAMI
ncbi:hypothetical protein R80B4_02236 [Fibrobacteres bacterium R8-0-B4]